MTTKKITTLALFSVICLLLPGLTLAQTNLQMVTTYNQHPECRWVGGLNTTTACSSSEKQDNTTPNKCNKTGPGICCCAAMATTYQKTNTTQKNTSINSDYTPLNFTPQIPMPGIKYEQGSSTAVGSFQGGVMTSDLLARYVKAFYDYGMAVVGILAAIVLMGGGLLWLVSNGNDSKITQAKELIIGSLAGMVILFGSWMLLNTINPDLLAMKSIRTKYVDVLIFGCCQSSGSAKMTSENECKTPDTFITNARKNSDGTKCEIEGCCAYTTASHHNPSDKYTSCVDTIKPNCPFTQTGVTGIRDFLENQRCAGVADCFNVTADCTSVKDGDTCYNMNDNYYCYNGKCYENDGKEGEPCGTNGGECTTEAHLKTTSSVPNPVLIPSLIINAVFSDNVTCDNNKTPDTGGRDCGTGLYCCY